MSAPPPARPRLWLQAGFLLLLTGAIVGLLFGRLHWTDWSAPHWLEGDPVEVYARVKIAQEQPGAALVNLATIESLGAPARADWTGYPAPDRLVFVLTGWLASSVGLIAAIQGMSALLLGLNAASFYLVARWLRWRWEWAAALAVAFALCTYNVRWGVTLSFSQTFTLPPLILLCARAARRGVTPSRSWTFLAAGLGFWLGQGNPYLAYFTGVVAGGTLLLAVLRRSAWPRFAPLVVFLAVLSGCFLAANASHIRHVLADTGSNPLVRSLDDVRTYSLRPLDWVVPPADHRLSALGALGGRYHTAREYRGEFFYNYLGLLGLCGLLGLLASRLRSLTRRRGRQLDSVLGLLWITAFGVVGGLNYWLGVAGLDLFRASGRIGIFAQVWVGLFLGGWLSRFFLTRARFVSVGLALALAGVAIWDQTPPLADATARRSNLARWQGYQSLTAGLERELPVGAMVFQLPVVPFPEAGRMGAMPDYEHLLPYLTSRSLRYSYGQLRTAPALRWAQHVSRLPASGLVDALERAGFSVLWVDPRAYPDAGAFLIATLQSTGRVTPIPAQAGLPIRAFRLNPSANPSLPDFADPRLQDPWDESADQPRLLALRGWYPLETDATKRWRWAKRHASLGLWADQGQPTVTLRFRLGGPASSVVVLQQDGRELWRAAPGEQIHTVRLSLNPGLNSLAWELIGPTFKPGRSDPRELGFMVENLSMSVP